MLKQTDNQTDRLLLAHSVNFITLTFVFVSHKIFSARLYIAPSSRLLRVGATAFLCPPPYSTYATGQSGVTYPVNDVVSRRWTSNSAGMTALASGQRSSGQLDGQLDTTTTIHSVERSRAA